METIVKKELEKIKHLLSKLIGSNELTEKERFSKAAIDKAAKEFRDLSIKRKEWERNDEIYTVIKDAHYGAGKFIIERLGFSNYFKRGHTLYFNRKDLLALKRELKERNINLNKYMELLDDKEKFNKYVQSIKISKSRKRKRFQIPERLKDIITTSFDPPSEKLVREHLNSLWEQYKYSDMVDYIDIFETQSYAMFKFEYYYDRYLDADLKQRCKKWCFEFNYANKALENILMAKVKPN